MYLVFMPGESYRNVFVVVFVENVPLVEFMYLVFMPGESYRIRSLPSGGVYVPCIYAR